MSDDTDDRPHVQTLRDMDVCPEAVDWAATQPSLRQAWRVCHRADWMLWYAAEIGADRRTLVLAACDIAETVAHLWPEVGREACRAALDTARAWARDEDGVTLADVRNASDAAYAAFIAYAAFAAFAASDAAFVASAAAFVASAAAYAAFVAAFAGEGTHAEHLRQSATIVRRYWPTLPTGETDHA